MGNDKNSACKIAIEINTCLKKQVTRIETIFPFKIFLKLLSPIGSEGGKRVTGK
jgi:hypothetical protein